MPDHNFVDHYSTLGYNGTDIDKPTIVDELKKSYKRLVLIHHPDKPTGNAQRFQTIQAAYETLCKGAKEKQQYDIKWRRHRAEEISRVARASAKEPAKQSAKAFAKSVPDESCYPPGAKKDPGNVPQNAAYPNIDPKVSRERPVSPGSPKFRRTAAPKTGRARSTDRGRPPRSGRRYEEPVRERQRTGSINIPRSYSTSRKPVHSEQPFYADTPLGPGIHNTHTSVPNYTAAGQNYTNPGPEYYTGPRPTPIRPEYGFYADIPLDSGLYKTAKAGTYYTAPGRYDTKSDSQSHTTSRPPPVNPAQQHTKPIRQRRNSTSKADSYSTTHKSIHPEARHQENIRGRSRISIDDEAVSYSTDYKPARTEDRYHEPRRDHRRKSHVKADSYSSSHKPVQPKDRHHEPVREHRQTHADKGGSSSTSHEPARPKERPAKRPSPGERLEDAVSRATRICEGLKSLIDSDCYYSFSAGSDTALQHYNTLKHWRGVQNLVQQWQNTWKRDKYVVDDCHHYLSSIERDLEAVDWKKRGRHFESIVRDYAKARNTADREDYRADFASEWKRWPKPKFSRDRK